MGLLPDWIEPLIKSSYLMHAFSKEQRLPSDILKEIHDTTVLKQKQLDHIIVIHDIPIGDGHLYTEDWFKGEIKKVLKNHMARIQNFDRDVIIQ